MTVCNHLKRSFSFVRKSKLDSSEEKNACKRKGILIQL
jgi:hypothetical protein